MVETLIFKNTDFADPRGVCPNSGEICSARQTLVKLFDTHVDAQLIASMPDDEFNPRYDHAKLNLRLAEYDMRAKLVDCSKATADVCPVRQSMDESPVRVGIVSALRKVLRKVNQDG